MNMHNDMQGGHQVENHGPDLATGRLMWPHHIVGFGQCGNSRFWTAVLAVAGGGQGVARRSRCCCGWRGPDGLAMAAVSGHWQKFCSRNDLMSEAPEDAVVVNGANELVEVHVEQ
jgi:hypothetical protein